MSNKQTIIARNIDYRVDPKTIDEYFSKAGSITNIKILADAQGNSKGIAFITFSNPDEANNAIQSFNGQIFNGKKLFVGLKNSETSSSNQKDENDLSSIDTLSNNDLKLLVQKMCNRLDSLEKVAYTLNNLNKNQISSINALNDNDDGNTKLFSLDQNLSSISNQNMPNDLADDDDYDIFDNDNLPPNFDDINFSDLSQDEKYQATIFRETMNIIKKGSYRDSNGNFNNIKTKVSESNKNTLTISKDISYDKYIKPRFSNKHKWGHKEKMSIYSKIEITDESTFSAASRIKSFGIKEVVVHCFANALSAGGGHKNNKIGQEEFLIRQSSLYSSLITQKKMYKYNRSHKNPFYSNFMIYSPNVVVIRDDDYNLIYPFRVSVISSPAVNNTEILSNHPNGEKNRDVYRCMKDRSRKILQLAISMNNKAIVLGAFGCGVLGNDPDIISKIFKELLVDEFYGKFFTKIIFAIKGKQNQRNVNLEAFKNAFSAG